MGTAIFAALGCALLHLPAQGQNVADPTLTVSLASGGLTQPIGMAFLGTNDFLVIEKSTGQVKRVVNGAVTAIALDLAVNSASERGLLGIALHPAFPATPWVYLFWTESSTGSDTTALSEVALLSNRVDRFIWDATAQTLTFDINLLRLRARQNDAGQPERGNHNGGVIRFGPDGKLYVQYGDQGRRGWLQNLPNGPFLPFAPDDQYGGPQPDNAHLSGVILRLNPDGTAPADNPFFAAGAAMGGEAGANIQKIYSYGHRNGFGLAFDPLSGWLWASDNGDDAFDEINRIVPGGNYGWIQNMGPISRIAQFKQIETMMFGSSLQQIRYPPTRIAYTSALALSRMFALPGSAYQDPELSWKYAIAPAGIAFVSGSGLGATHNGTLWVGASRETLDGGYLLRLNLTADRLHVAFSDPLLADRVADNLGKFDPTESESLRIGSDFGVCPDIQTGPDGNLYVVSLTRGAVYRISPAP